MTWRTPRSRRRARPAAVRLVPRKFRLDRLEDRTVPSAVYYPASTFLANPSFTGVPSQGKPALQPLDAALSFLGDHAAQLGLTAGDLADPIVTSQYTDADTGFAHLYLRQQVNGLPVINSDFGVGIAADGTVISAAGGFVSGLAASLGSGVAWPAISAVAAVGWAAADLGLTPTGEPAEVDPFVGPVARPLTSAMIDAEGVSLDLIAATLVYAPTGPGTAAVSWELVIRTPDGQHWYDMTVDATTGAVLSKADWVDNDTYNAVAVPNESPQDGGFVLISNPASSTASPFGWHDTNGVAGPEFTDTRGNNVDAHLDRDANNSADGSPGRPSGGTALDFSGYTYNPTLAPSALQNEFAAQVNLFTMINTLHDVHYMYGFTEAAGNFQTNNYGHGGAGNDAVQADAQDGSGTNNANFASPADGQAGRMQMYEWTAATPDRDGDLDNGVIAHEYGHGVSTRLTGGPANSSSLDADQSGGMGEGWSDFYALMFTQRATDTQNAGFGMGTYVIGQAQNGGGIRRFRYSFNMSTDPLMFDAYGSGTTSYGVTRSTEVHDTGEIWASTLWDMNWLLINKYGFDSNLAAGWSPNPGPAHAGNKLALRLVMEGLKLQPANPSFTQARDAIVAADVALNGGNDLYEIWSAFARRGLGEGASVGTSSSTATPTISTTLPMLVAGAGPTTGSVVTSHPASYTLTVSAAIDPATLDPSDLTVNNQPATAVDYTPGATTATFTFDADPVTADGPQTVRIAANAFTRASDSSNVSAYASTFYVDASPLTVTSVTPASNLPLPPPLTTVDVNFNQPIDPSSVQTTDLSISRGSVTAFSLLNGDTTVRFSVANLTNEGTLTMAVAAGAFFDLTGSPSAAFSNGTLTLDYGTLAFPAAFQARAPLGSLAYDGSFSALIGTPGDTDNFTVSLAANQKLTVTVTPDSNLRPTIALTGPGFSQSVSSTAAGSPVTLNQVTILTAGTYTLGVSGVSATTGRYTLQPTVNVIREAESNGGPANDTTATAQNLGATSFLNLGGGLASATVRGRSDPAGQVAEAEPNGTTATATPAGTYAPPPSGNLYQISLTGSLSSTNSSTESDYFNIGSMQAGDVLTLTASGSPSNRGAASDLRLRLYRGGSTSTPVADEDDNGPGFDSLLYRFAITTADTYYVRVNSANSQAGTTAGAYQVAALLENTGAAPATGGTSTAEVESNGSIATATNVSSAWRAVNYTATATGSITSGDTDLYAYQFQAGDVVSLTARATGTLTPQAALLNSGGTVLASEDGTSSVAGAGGFSPIYGYAIPSTGTYYFRVTGASGTTGGYTAEVTLSTPASFPIAPPGQDLYSLSLAAGQPASVVIKSATAGALAVAVLDATGAVVTTGAAGATNVDEAVSDFVAPAAGSYFVRVNGPANVDYQITLVTGGTFDLEPNDGFATAQPLATGGSALGAISGNDDWYQLTLAAGDVLTLTTATPGSPTGQIPNSLDPSIELYDPDNVLVGGDDNSAADGRNATLTHTAAAAGSYRVRVGGAGGTSGEYVLSANVTAVTPPPPPTVAAVQVNDGSNQRSEVRSLSVTFSTQVNIAGSPFSLTRFGGGTVELVMGTPTVDAQGRTVVTFTFSGTSGTDPLSAQNGGGLSLADGRYRLAIADGAVTDVASGQALDGDGDGTAGGPYASPADTAGGGAGQPKLYRLFGDADGNGVVDLNDLQRLRTTFNAAAPDPAYLDFLDADHNGVVDLVDLGQFRGRFNVTVLP